MSQTERILFIDRKLRSSGQITASQVSEYFEVSTRQVKRDIEYMRDRFNAPIVYNASKHVYAYEEDFRDLEFADQNLVVSYLALYSLLKSGRFVPVYAEDVLSQFRKDIPSDYTELLEKISYQLPQSEKMRSEYFEAICSAMRDRKCLEIEYSDVSGKMSCRVIEPVHLICYGGAWYVVGFDQDRQALRTFNISRISSMGISKKAFSRHDKSFEDKVKAFIAGGFGIFHGTSTKNVKIRFYGNASRIVSTQTWNEKQTITSGTEGNESFVELQFPAADYTEVLARVLSFGAGARPVAPEDFVDLWRSQIKAMNNLI